MDEEFPLSPTGFHDQTKDYLLDEAEQLLYELGKGLDTPEEVPKARPEREETRRLKLRFTPG